MKALLLPLALLSLLLVACDGGTGTPPDTSSALIDSLLAERIAVVALPTPRPGNDTLISLNRTICYGFCPAYGLVVTGSGRVFYNGHRFVQKTGRAEATIDGERVRAMVAAVNDAGFLTMDTTLDCTSTHSDASTALLYVRINGVERQISHYHGCMGFPEQAALLRLEQAIDSLSNVGFWTGK